MKKKSNNKAITLIALIVTIIILLILAGVTIGIATNGTGLFEKTKIAADKYNNAAEQEDINLNNLEYEIDMNSRDTVTIPKEEYEAIKTKTNKLGTLLWEGTWNSGSITVNGISNYTMCIAEDSTGGTGTFLVQNGSISTQHAFYSSERKSTEAAILVRTYTISGDTLTVTHYAYQGLVFSNPSSTAWTSGSVSTKESYGSIVKIYGLW